MTEKGFLHGASGAREQDVYKDITTYADDKGLPRWCGELGMPRSAEDASPHPHTVAGYFLHMCTVAHPTSTKSWMRYAGWCYKQGHVHTETLRATGCDVQRIRAVLQAAGSVAVARDNIDALVNDVCECLVEAVGEEDAYAALGSGGGQREEALRLAMESRCPWMSEVLMDALIDAWRRSKEHVLLLFRAAVESYFEYLRLAQVGLPCGCTCFAPLRVFARSQHLDLVHVVQVCSCARVCSRTRVCACVYFEYLFARLLVLCALGMTVSVYTHTTQSACQAATCVHTKPANIYAWHLHKTVGSNSRTPRFNGCMQAAGVASRRAEDCTDVTATLRILRLLVKHGEDMSDVFTANLRETPTGPWKTIVPQLFARLGHGQPAVRRYVHAYVHVHICARGAWPVDSWDMCACATHTYVHVCVHAHICAPGVRTAGTYKSCVLHT
jgi:hypothetical protein